ncbi:MAG TPA: hypothetical protein VK835_07515 [Bacteroidia bacterium]|jgi:hypothetical protein|nr:hypothetical protein [Bacteroidia bacterium]
MKKYSSLVTLLLLFSVGIFAQNLDSLKLTGKQISEDYTLTKTNNCISMQVRIFK